MTLLEEVLFCEIMDNAIADPNLWLWSFPENSCLLLSCYLGSFACFTPLSLFHYVETVLLLSRLVKATGDPSPSGSTFLL